MKQLEMLSQDLHYAVRSIRRQPGLAVATVLTLALGLGLNVSAYTFLQGLLFRARVDKQPETFIHLSPEYRRQGRREASWLLSVRDYRAYVSAARTLSALAAWSPVHARLGTGERDPQLALLVTCNFFEVYGLAAPRVGRLFSPAECESPGAGPVVLIGEEIWKDQFNSDPRVVGSTVRVNRTPYTIVGVLPAGFAGRIRGPGIWIPWTMQRSFFNGSNLFDSDSTRWLTAEGRLKPGCTRAEARSELAVIASQLDRLEPGRQTAMQITNGSFGEEPALRGSLFWIGPTIMGALTLILLIACTNVTVLQLSRAVARHREMGIRLSMGAGRGRLMRMLLTEILLLATLAGALSAYVAFKAPAIFVKLLATSSMPVYQTAPDLSVIIYLGVIILAAAIMAGLSPAAEALRGDLYGAMKPGGNVSVKGRRSFLVAAQVAMSLVLLVCAGLFLRAQYTMLTADPGFETRRVLFVSLEMPKAGIAASLGEIPGVDAIAAGYPLSQEEVGASADEVRLPGQAAGSGKPAAVTAVSANYFDALRISLLQGRSVANSREAVVSQAFAESWWPGKSPLGERAVLADGTVVSIVGVARDVESEHPGTVDSPHLYRWRDLSSADGLLIHFRGDTVTVASRVREAIKRLDPDSQPSPRTLRAILDENAERFSTMVRMVGVLAALALSLAILGIYGVVTFAVSQRTKEIGIRMALGAAKARLVRLVLASGVRAILWGVGAGILLAFVAAQAVATVLRHAPVSIQPKDPFVFLAVASALSLVALAAMLRPAFRAAAADPMRALRDE